ncbi:protease modulator HflC [Sphingomonas sp. BGYR3]|uniref:protease modulator HflC n=1 Tax=Sphingomonas sp. BGYR3 TaxID=2975483 RepID=UPI0021A80167|nr:protease modulator HflC [Sphingomonas sp. BGYR3]MDG5488458.1 protease modulator HflC [Sphingomonas sp. BGYR3]
MTAWYRNPVAIGILLVLAAVLLFGSVAVVPESKQAVILRLQRPVGVVNPYREGQPLGATGAGIFLRMPFLDRVVWVDKRVLSIDLDNQPVLSIDQLRLQVDAFARFRIVDPLQMVVSVRTEDGARQQLRTILASSLRNELSKRPFATLLSPERGQVMENIQVALNRQARQFGAEIVDVRIKQAELPSGSPLDSALNRMRSARQQEARTIEAQGFKQAQIVRAEAEAQAAQIYAQSFGKDAQFYDFWRAMQSYRRTFGADGNTTSGETAIILSPDNEYLRQFEGRGQR